MKLVLFSIALLGLAVLGIAIKIWAKKDGEFAGTCASQSPFLNKEGENCAVCGARPDEKCQSETPNFEE
ncbi:membrane or secreted protein [Parvicella tangerina]|uniref:Membrane or secreted protein n=1 Tax=Parvicella tangerina TaxID=2829795 RepID=A0A916JQP4_9FLAO|nr:membrane or secreted protein [Parvicella tangerina]CAG5084982.1 hypothetical protein CRYO30217_02616 [Parvicella tangerina]